LPLSRKLHTDNAAKLLREHDIVIEGSDDLYTKFLVNDYALALGLPAVIGGVVRFAGQVLTVWPGAACYRCLFEAPPEPGVAQSCQEAGVLGPACGVVAGIMADEALRILDGDGPRLSGTLLSLDLGSWQLRRVAIGRRHDCRACAATTAAAAAPAAAT
jgi:molybdopterin/thiamine biosynthesis adenylyltransferase